MEDQGTNCKFCWFLDLGAACRAARTAGSNIATSTLMIAITTSSSTTVNVAFGWRESGGSGGVRGDS